MTCECKLQHVEALRRHIQHQAESIRGAPRHFWNNKASLKWQPLQEVGKSAVATGHKVTNPIRDSLCVPHAWVLILFDRIKQSIAHCGVTLLISYRNQFGFYSRTNSGNTTRHTIVGTHSLHNYSYDAGHSLTDINELPESHEEN